MHKDPLLNPKRPTRASGSRSRPRIASARRTFALGSPGTSVRQCVRLVRARAKQRLSVLGCYPDAFDLAPEPRPVTLRGGSADLPSLQSKPFDDVDVSGEAVADQPLLELLPHLVGRRVDRGPSRRHLPRPGRTGNGISFDPAAAASSASARADRTAPSPASLASASASLAFRIGDCTSVEASGSARTVRPASVRTARAPMLPICHSLTH